MQSTAPRGGHPFGMALLAALLVLPGPAAVWAAPQETAPAAGEAYAVSARVHATLAAAFAAEPLSSAWPRLPDDTLNSEGAFDAAIQAAVADNNLTRCLHLCIRALLDLPVSASFPGRWSRALAFAEGRERAFGATAPDTTADVLASVADAWPHGEDAYWSGQVIVVGRAARRGEGLGVLHRLRALVADPRMPERFRPDFEGQLGTALEGTKDYQGALESYAQLERSAPAVPSSAGALLHAVFINLDLGRTPEAMRIIRILGTVPGAVLDKANGAAQIREFVGLLNAGAVPDFWTRSRVWWSQWQALPFASSAEGKGLETSVPVIASEDALRAELAAAFGAHDTATLESELRRLVSAARWLPHAAVEVSDFEGIMNELEPGFGGDFRKLCIRILEGEQDALGDPEGLRRRQVALAGAYLNDNRPQTAITVVQAFHRGIDRDDMAQRAMNLAWGAALSTLRASDPACIKALQGDLAGPVLSTDGVNPALLRVHEVLMVAGLLALADRGEEGRALVERESLNPVIAGNVEAHRLIEVVRRQLGLAQEGEPGAPGTDDGGPVMLGGSGSSTSAEERRQAALRKEAAVRQEHQNQAAELRDAQIEFLTKKLSTHGDDAADYLMRGSLELEKGELDKAVADLDRALSLDHDYAHAYRVRGQAKLQKGDDAGAVADFSACLKGDHDSAEAYAGRAEARMHQGDWDRALADLDRVIELNPVDPHAYHARGVCKKHLEDNLGADDDFAKAKGYGYSEEAAGSR